MILAVGTQGIVTVPVLTGRNQNIVHVIEGIPFATGHGSDLGST